MNLNEKDYVAIVQCQIMKQRCSGYGCEKAFTDRTGGFSEYPRERNYRTLYLTCGGCSGRAVHRMLMHLVRKLRKIEEMDKDRIVVQLSSCVTKDSYHGPPCPHLGYIRKLVDRTGLDYREGTVISKQAEARREGGIYDASPGE